MITIIVAAILMQTLPGAAQQSSDSGRIVDGRLVVEPLGVSFQLPETWVNPAARQVSGRSCITVWNHPGPRLYLNRIEFPGLLRATGEWDREYSAVVDSTLPFASLVAQMGDEPWGRGGGGGCFNDLQVRIYVGDFTEGEAREWITVRGKAAAERVFPPASVTINDSTTAGWRKTLLTWPGRYGDYGATANVELFTRRERGRTVALVFFHPGEGSGARSHIRPSRELILSSYRAGGGR